MNQNKWYTFPLKANSKLPATPNGFKDAKTEWPEGTYSNKNVGIRTGIESGIVVLDIDEKSGGYQSLERLEKELGQLPKTYTVKTGGGGRHYYFKHPGEPVKNKVGLFKGIDLRGDGGYVVGPGSTHESGSKYEVIDNAELAELPSWLSTAINQSKVIQIPTQLNTGVYKGTLSRSTLEFLVNGAEEGTWNATLFKATKDMQEQGWTLEEALEKLERITGHLDQVDLRTIESAFKEPPKHAPRALDSENNEVLVVTAYDLTAKMFDYLDDKDLVKGEPTGISELDYLLGGGKRLGEVTAWHAEAKTGKNSLWHALMLRWLEKGIPIGYASRELTPETEVLPNILSLAYEKNIWLAPLNDEIKEEIKTKLSSWPLFFANGYGHFPMQDLESWVVDLKQRGVEYFWFDHLHYMLEDPEDHKEASKLIKMIKALAKRENIHIDIIIQPNKLMDNQKLSLGTIKGGAAMGQAIDNLITLERVKYAKNTLQVTMEAARSKLAQLGYFYLGYDPETTCFYKKTKQEVDLERDKALTYNES